MRKAILILSVAFFGLTAKAQERPEVTIGNGISTKESRKVETFDKLSVSGPFEVRLVPGDTGSITIEGEKNLTGLIVAEVSDRTLTIAPMPGKLFKSSRDNKIIIKVPFTALNEIAFKGSGSVTSKRIIKSDLKVTLDGSGLVDLAVETGKAEAYVMGSGKIKLRGTAGIFKCDVSGSGIAEAYDLLSDAVDVTISGSGNAHVHSNKTITGRISGSGNVAFAGEPKERDLRRTGTGEFKVY